MDRQKGVNTTSTQSFHTGTVEEGGIPAQRKSGSWLARKWRSWKVKATDFLKSHGILPDKPIIDRKIDERSSASPTFVGTRQNRTRATSTPQRQPASSAPSTKSGASHRRPQQKTSQTQVTKPSDHKPSAAKQYFLQFPCEFALRRIDDERQIPKHFVSKALRPGLSAQWQKTANISKDQANKMISLLVNSFGIEGMDVNEQYLDSYEHNSQFEPLSPSRKFKLILKWGEQLKTPEAQQNFNKITDALSYYETTLEQQEIDPAERQAAMGHLAEYLIDNASNLPDLTSKELAACSHFSKYLQSMQYDVSDFEEEMTRFVSYITDQSEFFNSAMPSAMAANYIYSAEFEDEKAHLPKVLTPLKPDSGG